MSIALKAKGMTGSWFAEIAGEQVPCVHKHWTDARSMVYHDPLIRLGNRQDDEFVESIQKLKRVALCEDEIIANPGNAPGFKRKSYIALFEVSEITCDDEGLRFRFAKRGPSLR